MDYLKMFIESIDAKVIDNVKKHQPINMPSPLVIRSNMIGGWMGL